MGTRNRQRRRQKQLKQGSRQRSYQPRREPESHASGSEPVDGPGPSQPTRSRSAADDRVLERVRALLAKAESTTFPEEAEALTAKAQELMARHAIDRAMLDAAARGDGAAADVGRRRLAVDNPYAGVKAILLQYVAEANRCRSVWSADYGFSTVFGHGDDIDDVELLFTSLLRQATTAMVGHGKTDVRARTRSFRQSFLVAYASRIGHRLREQTDAVTSVADEDHGGRLLPVLAARAAAVDDALDRAFPHMTAKGFSANDAAGWAAGAAAAELASLDHRTALESER